MRISTALNHERRLKGHVSGIYSMARICGSTHKHILDSLQARVYSDPAWDKVPSWVQTRVFALGHSLLDRLYRPDLYAKEFERMLSDAREGKPVPPVAYLRSQTRMADTLEWVTTDTVCERRAAGDETVWQRTESAFVWNHKPEDHPPFSLWRPWGPK